MISFLPSFSTDWLGAASWAVSMFSAPVIIALCRRKSTRLTAVIGGLVLALGILFTSFATQFHQVALSYGEYHLVVRSNIFASKMGKQSFINFGIIMIQPFNGKWPSVGIKRFGFEANFDIITSNKWERCYLGEKKTFRYNPIKWKCSPICLASNHNQSILGWE